MADGDDTTWEELLKDAKKVALYGMRIGKLRGSEIFEAIRDYEAESVKAWGSPATIKLHHSLNGALSEIAPVTLLDLRNRDPFNHRAIDIARSAFLILASVLLMGVTAYFTVQYNKGQDLLARLLEIQADDPGEKMSAVARTWKTATKSIKADDYSATETYFQMLNDVRELDRKARVLMAEVGDYGGEVSQRVITSLTDTPQVSAQPTDPGKLPNLSCGGQRNGSIDTNDPWFKSAPGTFLAENRDLIIKFACAEDILITPYFASAGAFNEGMVRRTLTVYGQWVLPALYGLLGSLVFYMRSVLNPMMPDPPLPQILHRVALGGFAAIIFAWFWTPSATDGSMAGVTVNYFAIAFIIGFSIELFFSLLDRFVTFMQGLVAGPNAFALSVPAAAPPLDASHAAQQRTTTEAEKAARDRERANAMKAAAEREAAEREAAERAAAEQPGERQATADPAAQAAAEQAASDNGATQNSGENPSAEEVESGDNTRTRTAEGH